jgi:precorrin-6A/cobalt-precorrin-6A reductase
MIILLGKSAAALEISEYLKNRGVEFTRIETLTETTCLQTSSLILDVSHPFSSIGFAPLSHRCEQQGIPYLRLERPEIIIPASPLIYPVYNWEEALLRLEERVAKLYREKRRTITIFITTGSNKLESIVHSSFARSARLVVRVLPEEHLIRKCSELGIRPKDIIGMQGPFSKGINKALFKFYKADLVLTRDSGLEGGTDTKMSAALELGLEIVLIKKTNNSSGCTVHTIKELLDWVDAHVQHI